MTRERVIVTGGRDFGHAPAGASPDRVRQAARERRFVSVTLSRELRVQTAWAYDRLLVVVGDCPTGVDAIVREACKAWGLRCKPYEAGWTRFGHYAGPERNGRMVADGAIRCIAFPGGSGTTDCIRQAQGAGIPVVLVAFSP